jgi:hypothetical protein
MHHFAVTTSAMFVSVSLATFYYYCSNKLLAGMQEMLTFTNSLKIVAEPAVLTDK